MFNPEDLVPGALNAVAGVLTGVADPQLGYMWEVEISSPTRTHEFESSAYLFARSCTLPQRSVETMDRHYIGEMISHPGHKLDPKTVNVVFWDDRKMSGYRYFNQWMNVISDPTTGKQVSRSSYVKNVRVSLKDRSNLFSGVVIDFKNCYISQIGDVTMSYEESTPFIYSVTLKYQNMYINEEEYRTSTYSKNDTILNRLNNQAGISADLNSRIVNEFTNLI